MADEPTNEGRSESQTVEVSRKTLEVLFGNYSGNFSNDSEALEEAEAILDESDPSDTEKESDSSDTEKESDIPNGWMETV